MKINNPFENKLAKTKAAKTSEEIRAFAAESNIELSPEELDTVSGGFEDYMIDYITKCRKCGSTNIESFFQPEFGAYGHGVKCKDCGWTIS